ncbi:OLC1v1029043C1 [Oldenlandia corymbosa var. corymbosa]|uniref:OLC1v1029043C1 n=1 Tax=Oldenlandia corymbosa var. corymbosa TaxID=529605 RepID=A0AAV1CDX1_OLDCO|nr:OLC1v1029043C1 [Oldenlandia corymbosa var. corymbosa]
MNRECLLIPFKDGRVLWLILLVFVSFLTVQHFDVSSYGFGIFRFFSAAKTSSLQISSPNYASGLSNFSTKLEKTCSYTVNCSESDQHGGTKNGLKTERGGDFEPVNEVANISTSDNIQNFTKSASGFEETGKINISSTLTNVDSGNETLSPPLGSNLTAEENRRNVVSGQNQSHFCSSSGDFSQWTTNGSVVSVRDLYDMLLRRTSCIRNSTVDFLSGQSL